MQSKTIPDSCPHCNSNDFHVVKETAEDITMDDGMVVKVRESIGSVTMIACVGCDTRLYDVR